MILNASNCCYLLVSQNKTALALMIWLKLLIYKAVDKFKSSLLG